MRTLRDLLKDSEISACFENELKQTANFDGNF